MPNAESQRPSAGPLSAPGAEERAAHQRAEAGRANARQAMKAKALVPKEGLNIDEMRRQYASDKARALAGVAGSDFFPETTCPICGEVLWVNARTGRNEMEHDARKHDAPANVRIDPRKAASVGDVLSRMKSVQRTLDERDDD